MVGVLDGEEEGEPVQCADEAVEQQRVEEIALRFCEAASHFGDSLNSQLDTSYISVGCICQSIVFETSGIIRLAVAWWRKLGFCGC